MTVLVIGMESIGGYYAKLMKSFRVYVIGIRRRGSEKADYADEVYAVDA